jgi:hypothetical protein
MIGVLGFDSRWGLGIFLFTTATRTALRPTRPPILWVTGAPSLRVKRPGREADHTPPCSAEVKEWVELYLYSPMRLYGVVLSLKKKHRDNFTFYLSPRPERSGAHPASYPIGTGALSLRVKRPGREADHSPPSSAEVKNAWSYTSTPICLHGVVLS